MTVFLSVEQVIEIHDNALKFGGLPGIRSKHLLASSIGMPEMQAFGEELYPGMSDKAAAYLYFIVKNHPFNDGNKRTGAATAQLFLRLKCL